MNVSIDTLINTEHDCQVPTLFTPPPYTERREAIRQGKKKKKEVNDVDLSKNNQKETRV